MAEKETNACECRRSDNDAGVNDERPTSRRSGIPRVGARVKRNDAVTVTCRRREEKTEEESASSRGDSLSFAAIVRLVVIRVSTFRRAFERRGPLMAIEAAPRRCFRTARGVIASS